MKTNRDLYKAIESLLVEKKGSDSPTLEIYLGHLRDGASGFSDRPAIPVDQFFTLLKDAFDGADSSGISSSKPNAEFDALTSVINGQIQDLKEMAANGQLNDDQKYFGIDAPSGRRWYNFEACAFIECGAAGALGGWEEGDKTGRAHVPGQTAATDSNGMTKSCDPRKLDRESETVPEITWEMFSEFVWCGQNYE